MKATIEVTHLATGKLLHIECASTHVDDTLRVTSDSFRQQCKEQGVTYEIRFSSSYSTLAQRTLIDMFRVNSTLIGLQVVDETFCGRSETLLPEWYTASLINNDWFYYLCSKNILK